MRDHFISAYFQHKPSCYRKCYKGADVDEEDDNQVANPGQPSLRGILKKRNRSESLRVFSVASHGDNYSACKQVYDVVRGFKGSFLKSERSGLGLGDYNI